ncbi:MAG TPA: SpoIIE family protein phosphatase [Candidatus Angelobacter sp.]|nr:SpoIIE family protein phosphatase [Candidatus Angelobacter sp.]
MAIWTKITHKLAAWGMIPRTRLAYFTLYTAGMEAVLLLLLGLLHLAGAARAANTLSGWASFVGWVLAILLVVLSLRWFRTYVLWSVRSRLIVTYLFIGGVPITLLAAMAIGLGYGAVAQMATVVAVSEIRAEEQSLAADNAAAVEEMERHGGTAEQIAARDMTFAGHSITVKPQAAAPEWMKNGFAGLVADHGHLYLRAAHLARLKEPVMVISSVPFDQKILARIAGKLGSLTISRADFEGDKTDSQKASSTSRPGTSEQISAGSVPAPFGRFDPELPFFGMLQAVDVESGKPDIKLILGGTTRASVLYFNLAASMGFWNGTLGIVLLICAIALALVVLAALLIGISLTRRITYSVANLYRATQHINRGDFTHRIQVRERDQLAALQLAFNSMTQSVERLILEQKEKERLQSELEIAHEVQANLFPHTVAGTSTLELHGICRPARIVSGDYYDFLSYGAEQVGIAVGDISGKGISAALLMATIHSAVRAYEQEQLVSVGTAAAYGTNTRIAAVEAQVAPASPGQMLWLLNRHLFQSTQPEKYATLFLGFYDDLNHRLTYSNAGHLPPIVLSRDGSVRRLDRGGTVVGLFPDRDYEEETVELYSGDVFVAFSDGITEPENEFGEFGEDRLIETIAAYRHLPLPRITEHVILAVQDWIGSTEQPDDITLVLARCI